MKIELQTKLLKLKGTLNDISHASFSYAQLTKQYPMHNLDDEKAQQIINAYESIISDVRNLIMKNEHTNSKNESMAG